MVATCELATTTMDWYSWLSTSGLHPDLAYDYALLFVRNELTAADVGHLDHDVLASMGVSVAKHRLEILKLAKKGRQGGAALLPWRALAAVVRRSGRSLAGYLRSMARRDRSAVAVVPRTPPQWRSASAARRGRKLALLKRLSRPVGAYVTEAKAVAARCYDEQEEEEVKWECMFQDLNPT